MTASRVYDVKFHLTKIEHFNAIRVNQIRVLVLFGKVGGRHPLKCAEVLIINSHFMTIPSGLPAFVNLLHWFSAASAGMNGLVATIYITRAVGEGHANQQQQNQRPKSS